MLKSYALTLMLTVPAFLFGQQTTVLKDVNESGNASPTYLCTDGSYLYYKADNGADGAEIVYSQGSMETTTYVDVMEGTMTTGIPGQTPYSAPQEIALAYPTFYKGKLYFKGAMGYTYNELYGIDRPDLATMTFDPATETASVAIDSLQMYYTEIYNDVLYFSSYAKPKNIYSWDGENAPVELPGQDSINSNGVFKRIGDYMVIYGTMYDDAATTEVDESAYGRELIGYNMTTGASEYLGDFKVGGNSSFTINDFAVVGEKLYFEVNNQLYETDGTAANTKAVMPANGFFVMTKVYGYLHAFDGKLLFQGKDVADAEGNSTYGNQLFSYDPAEATGARISTIESSSEPGTYVSHYSQAYVTAGDYVYYIGKDSTKVNRLFCTDGATTTMVDTSVVADTKAPVYFMDKIYFAGSTDTYGKEVFVYNPVVTAVETAEMEANNMVVYPNPSNGVLYLKGLQNQNAAYEIYNLAGQSIEKGFVQNAMVDYNVETGVYLLKITDGATNNVQVITVK